MYFWSPPNPNHVMNGNNENIFEGKDANTWGTNGGVNGSPQGYVQLKPVDMANLKKEPLQRLFSI